MGAEIKHFTLEQKDDNTYGWPWNEVVRKYLEAGYESENKQCELTIRDEVSVPDIDGLEKNKIKE